MLNRMKRLAEMMIIPVQTPCLVVRRLTARLCNLNRASLLVLIVILLFSSCITSPDISDTNPINTIHIKNQNIELSDTQKLLLEQANRIIGAEKLFVNNKSFSMDCSGTVMAIYWYAGIDLAEAFPDYTGGGTERIYKYLRDKKLLYKTDLPKPGDIIFWDNTFDKNGNGKQDDYLTHMGMVVSVDDKGNIEYIHENYRKGIILAKMNLYKPDDYFEIIDGEKIVLNDPMRMRGSPESKNWLSSQLYSDFGMGYLLK
jgi:hypothetical protein